MATIKKIINTGKNKDKLKPGVQCAAALENLAWQFQKKKKR